MQNEEITLNALEKGSGLFVNKLGNAKLRQADKKILFYRDLNPLVHELSKLDIHVTNLYKNISTMPNYRFSAELINFIKVLNITKHSVENKLLEILPLEGINKQKSRRIKRGLINGLGSIFKAITGNLDANDGQHFEDLIQKLNSNEIKLQKQVKDNHILSTVLVNKFNDSLNQISHYQRLLSSKLLIIQQFINKKIKQDSLNAIRDVILQILSTYQAINDKLEDIENSIAFSKLQTLHPSIITQKDLLFELKRFDQTLNHFPLDLTLENIHLIEKIINVDSYMFNNKLTFILSIPVTYNFTFEYFQLVPVPKPLFNNPDVYSVIIPSSNFVLKSQMYFSLDPRRCTKLSQLYYCHHANLREFPDNDNNCEISILTNKLSHEKCKEIHTHMAQNVIFQIENTSKWIGVFPNITTLKLDCNNKKPQKLVQGTYLIDIPRTCKIYTPNGILANEATSFEQTEEIEFELKNTKILQPKVNLTMEHFKNNFQNLPMLKDHVEYIEELAVPTNFQTPWVIIVATIIIIILILFICFKCLRYPHQRLWTVRQRRGRNNPENQQEAIDLTNVQLPTRMVSS